MSLVLLATSPRVAPGLLSAAAWDALRAGSVYVDDEAHPQVAPVRAAGIDVSVVSSPPGGDVVWLLPPGDDGAGFPDARVVVGSADLPGARLLDLVAVMDRLRSPGGCPWDAEQTHRSLATYLLEETYETLEAIESDNDDDLREELGDLLLQVIFHARLAQERATQPWGIDEVAAGIEDKLVRRHPHVFGDVQASSASDVGERWERLKREEKNRSSAVDGVPLAQPALSLAAKLVHRVEKAGVPVPAPAPPGRAPESAEEVGDALFALAAAARDRGIDPEQALRDAARRYVAAVKAAEATR
ncbi:MazG family protein [Jiangella alkaliphila]|uniref:XTP/dITP diphosphohydrolase n=1 Tax=Jiangella alkaliphila TaxID=419479 RepID=A0A1H2J3T7_9ACTN|nr:MazG family protein [Jiangella alkaliphila]SDU51103.1 XTP/dITP diphosphohydrolase [Jiangella alkaliphila]